MRMLMLLPVLCLAQAADYEIVVTGERDLEEASTATVSVIRKEQFAGTGRTLSEMIDQESGIRVRKMGGLGEYSGVSIRGSASEQVKVFLDGVPLIGADGKAADLGKIPLSQVERVEIYKGTIPPEFQGNGTGGVVNIVTNRAGKGFLSAEATVGSFGTEKAGAAMSGRNNNLVYSAGLDYQNSANDYQWLDDRDTHFGSAPLADDTIRSMENNDFTSYAGTVKAGYDLPGGILAGAGGNIRYFRKGMFYTLAAPPFRARQEGLEQDYLLSFARGGQRWTGEARGTFRVTSNSVKDPDGALYYTARDVTDRSMEIWGAGALKFHPGSFLSSALHVQAGRETFREENHYEETSPGRPNAQRYSAIATLSGEMKLLPARLLAHGAYTYDRRMSRSDYQDFNLSWRRVSDAYVAGDHHNCNAGLRFDPSPAHQIKLNAGYYTRVPDFGELFGNNAFSAGNCELLPEKGVNSDVTFISRLSLPHLSGARHSLSVFLNHINDQIVYRMFNRIVKPENMGDVRIAGAEQDVEAAWRGLKVRNQAAFMRSEIIRAPVDSLYLNRERAYLPAFKNTLLLELRLSRWIEAGYGLNARSGYYTSEYNLARVPAAVTHDAMARVPVPGSGLKLTVEIKNMTDEKSCDVEGFPLPGRAFYATLAYQSTR